MKSINISILAVAISASAMAQTNNADSVTYALGEVVVKANPRVTSLKVMHS